MAIDDDSNEKENTSDDKQLTNETSATNDNNDNNDKSNSNSNNKEKSNNKILQEKNINVKIENKQQSLSAISTSRRLLLDIFSLCVHGHTYRMKYFIMRNSVISRTLRVLESNHRQLHVGAIKFVRTIIATKDEFYNRHIVKLDLLRPVLEALTGSAKRDNLISSAIAELVEFVFYFHIYVLFL